MFKQAKKKLNSEKGSTMILALFFFLICVVMAAAILVAGSASAGRVAKTAETDRRYYSINSAAQFFAGKLDGRSAKVTRSKTTNTVTVTALTVGADGSTTRGIPQITESVQYDAELETESGTAEVQRDRSLVTDMVIDLVFGENTTLFAGEDSWNVAVPALSADKETGLALTHSEDEMSRLDADITATLETDGTLIILITDSDGEGYSLRVIFSADIHNSEENSKETTDKTVTKNSETSFTEQLKEKSVEKRITEITWTLKEIKRVSADD